MRRVLLPLVLILSAGSAARAEDFSGFYAGVNAGYAKGQSRDLTVGGPVPGTAAERGRSGPDLPPSAADAAASLRRPGRAAAAPDGR